MDPTPSTASYVSSLVQTVAALVVVCVAAWWILRWGVARGPLGTKGTHIEVIDRVALDTRRAVYLLRIGDRVLVVGAGDQALTLLAELSAQELPPLPERTEAPSLAAWLRALRKTPTASAETERTP